MDTFIDHRLVNPDGKDAIANGMGGNIDQTPTYHNSLSYFSILAIN
jgi:hypothetical protein